MPRIAQLGPTHFEMLRALNTYRLLTYELMLRIGVARTQKTLGVTADYLERHGMIDRLGAVIVGRSPLPNIFWLTPKGAAVLHDFDPETDARGADRTMRDTHEVKHRLGIVALHIAVQEWATAAGVELVQFVGDYDRGAKGLGKATRIEGPEDLRFVPDALAWVQLPGEDDVRLLVIEFERGGERGDLTTFFSGHQKRGKLSFLRMVSESRFIERAYAARGQAIQRPRFLIVFGSHRKDPAGHKIELHRKALDKWPDPEAGVWGWFFIKDEDEAAAGFGGGWHQPGDRPQRDLFKLLAQADGCPPSVTVYA